MSEAILPCAVCGGEAKIQSEDMSNTTGHVYLLCRICEIRSHASLYRIPVDAQWTLARGRAVENWNTLMKWIADGRAVEKLDTRNTTARLTHDGWTIHTCKGFLNSIEEHHAPTLAEAVRKAQGDE